MTEALLFFVGGAAENRAHSHAHREKTRGLAKDQVEMLLQRYRKTELFHLEEFAFDHLLGQFDQHIEDAEIALVNRDLECLHVEPVAGQHAHGVAPLRIGGGPAAASLGLIDDVVMNERRGVNNFNDRGELYRATALVVKKFGGEQQQRGADSLAPAG